MSVFVRDSGITVEKLNEIAAKRTDSETFSGVTKGDILNYAAGAFVRGFYRPRGSDLLL